MLYAYTAINSGGKRLSDRLEAGDRNEAHRALTRDGLFVLSLKPLEDEPTQREAGGLLISGSQTRTASTANVEPRARNSEVLMFARQMSMMLRAGAAVVPAIEAINEQPGRAPWHALLRDLAERVEGGSTLHEALARHSRYFNGMMVNMIAAGEGTGTLADAFSRLSSVLESKIRIRKRVVSSLTYPAVLMLLATAVIITMTTFVLPRFSSLFEMLDSELPAITQVMLTASDWGRTHWPVALTTVAVPLTLGLLFVLSNKGRVQISRRIVRAPVIGRVFCGVILAQLLQMWAALLRSRVSLLDAIQQARDSTRNVAFGELLADLEQAVTEGRAMAPVLKQSGLVPAPVVSAIATGEESGRLGEAMEFVGGWLEEENNIRIETITRALEPGILCVMGLVVGGVCIGLFLPLFDIATAAG